MTYLEDSAVIDWLSNRLVYKLGEKQKSWYVLYMQDLSKRIANPKLSINRDDLDKIISTYYADFFLDKDSNLGYTDEERDALRTVIISIYEDITRLKLRKRQK